MPKQLTPRWIGILPLLCAGLTDGTDRGRALAKAEFESMALTADRAVAVDDYVKAYLGALNDAEIAPNGDDFNALADGIDALLGGEPAPAIAITSKGR